MSFATLIRREWQNNEPNSWEPTPGGSYNGPGATVNESHHRSGVSVGVIIAIVFVALVLVVVCLLGFWFIWKGHRGGAAGGGGGKAGIINRMMAKVGGKGGQRNNDAEMGNVSTGTRNPYPHQGPGGHHAGSVSSMGSD